MKKYDFYIVPTPIGNLSDITLRAIEILKEVDLIACEDSRVTQKLLNHYNIQTKCISYHKYNEKERITKILEVLKSGKTMALVSDAGTPLVCDPGSVIVKELRQNGFTLTALPGANAIITFLSQISRENEDFKFIGFIPKTSSKIEELVLKNKQENLIFYEAPNRIIQTLETISKVRGNAIVAYGRELTKLFEDVYIEKINSVIVHLKDNISKGEFVVMVCKDFEATDNDEITEKIEILKNKGFSAKDISIILSELYNYNKNKIYKLALGKNF